MVPGLSTASADGSLAAAALPQVDDFQRVPSLRVYLTGFGPFGQIRDNPSATLVQAVAAALSASGALHDASAPDPAKNKPPLWPLEASVESCVPETHSDAAGGSAGIVRRTPDIELCGWEILEVSAEAAKEAVPRIHSILCNQVPGRQASHRATACASNIAATVQADHGDAGTPEPFFKKASAPSRIALHFGVSAKSTGWKLETVAKNDGRFPCKDERGCFPPTEQICCSMPLDVRLRCPLPLEKIAEELSQRDIRCSVSTDAGCFVCNYLYFKSLHEGQKSGVDVLFVHVPPFSEMPLQKQLCAALQLLSFIAKENAFFAASGSASRAH